MKLQRSLKTGAGAAALILGAALPGFAATGPSSSETPYLTPIHPGVEFTSILTVADIDGTGTKQSDEESSGIIEVTKMFDHVRGYDTRHDRYFLLDVQAHYSSVNSVPLDAELVEGGQLLLMAVPGGTDADEDEGSEYWGHEGRE